MSSTHETRMPPFAARIDDEGVLWVTGELDLAVAEEFSTAALSALDGQREFVIDLSGLSFLDSTGVRAVMAIASTTDRGIVLRAPQRGVRRVLEITGIHGRAGIRVESRSGANGPGV